MGDISWQPNEVFMKCSSFVIQKYVEKPMLIRGRKFDIRMWVLITHAMDLFVCREGYLRYWATWGRAREERLASGSPWMKQGKMILSCTSPITQCKLIDGQESCFSQKQSSSYGSFEAGNQLSFEDFKAYLAEQNLSDNFEGEILMQIKNQIVLAANSVKSKLNKNDCRYCFELFGFDFLVDQFLRVWLIEVNTNPCIELSSPLLRQLIPRMINDALNLTVDQLFPPRETPESLQAVNAFLSKLNPHTPTTTTQVTPVVRHHDIQLVAHSPTSALQQELKPQQSMAQSAVLPSPPAKSGVEIEVKSQKREHRRLRKMKENEKKHRHENYNFYEEYDDITRQMTVTKKQFNYEVEEYFKNILSRSDLEDKPTLTNESASNNNNNINNCTMESQEEQQKKDPEEPPVMQGVDILVCEETRDQRSLSTPGANLSFQEKLFVFWRSRFPVKGYTEFQSIWEFTQSLGMGSGLGYA